MTSPTSELRPCFHMKIMYCCNTMRFESHLIPHTSNSALLLSGSFCYSNMSLAPLLERKKKVEPSDSFKPAAVHGYRKESELLTVQLKPPLTPTNDTKQLFVLMGISFSKYTDTKSLCSGDRFHNCISWWKEMSWTGYCSLLATLQEMRTLGSCTHKVQSCVSYWIKKALIKCLPLVHRHLSHTDHLVHTSYHLVQKGDYFDSQIPVPPYTMW